MRLLKSSVLITCISCFLGATAQVPDVDSLFARARDYAFQEKDYPRALSTAKHALALAPAYIDIMVFTGRVHAWMKEADSARFYFAKALHLDSSHVDALSAYSDLEFWEKQYEQSLARAEQGLSVHSSSTVLLYRKGRALYALERFDHAAITLSQLLKLEPGNSEARKLLEETTNILASNRIEIQYHYLSSQKQFSKPWHMTALGYTRQGKAGAYTARLYYASRFGESGTQYELEAYPRFSKRLSAYAALAYSNEETVFPKWRLGASVLASFSKGFELEAGYRRLQFNTSTDIITFSLGKYYSNWLFGARTFIVPTDSITTHATSVFARRYFGARNDFIGISLTSGISPDERNTNLLIGKMNRLNTFRVEITGRWSFSALNTVQYGVAFINQELSGGSDDKQFQLSIGYARRF